MLKQTTIFQNQTFTTQEITPDGIQTFKTIIWDYYKKFGRQFPWRMTTDPYNIVVSEVMLQQTQTYRVEPKYTAFLQELPNFYSLANASQRDVLRLWQGLGYNRRALGLQKLAHIVMQEYAGKLPDTPEVLETLPTLGHATARSVATFAFNTPQIFIETNIRTVYIHTFFGNKLENNTVHDRELLPLIAQTVDTKNPRQWYYALMDYGVMLKKKFKNPSRKSKHHTQQSKFIGSDRQIRGAIIRVLTHNNTLLLDELIASVCQEVGCQEERALNILDSLHKEQFVKTSNNYYFL